MNNLKEASDSIKRLAIMFKSLTDLSEVIDDISSLENHIEELKVGRDALLAQNDRLRVDNAQLDSAIVSRSQYAKEILEKSKASEEEIGLSIKSKEEELAKSLEEMSLNKNNELNAELDLMKSKFEASVVDAKIELEDLNSQIEDRSKKLAEINIALGKIKEGI